MPTYAYACTECDHRFEAVQSFSDDSLTVCPECEGRLRKVFNAVGIVFKGGGFYRTDSRSGSSVTAGSATNGSGSSEKSESSGSSEKSSAPARRRSRRARRARRAVRPQPPRRPRRRPHPRADPPDAGRRRLASSACRVRPARCPACSAGAAGRAGGGPCCAGCCPPRSPPRPWRSWCCSCGHRPSRCPPWSSPPATCPPARCCSPPTCASTTCRAAPPSPVPSRPSRMPWAAGWVPGWPAARASRHPGWCPAARSTACPPAGSPCTWCRPTRPRSTCSPPGCPPGSTRSAGGPALAVGATVLAADPATVGGPVSLTDAPPRGVVLSLSADEADAVLAGHGSLEGPVTVTVVAAPG